MAEIPCSAQPTHSVRRRTGSFPFSSKITTGWPTPENGRSGFGHPRHSATMPPLGRITSGGTMTSQQFVKIESAPESSHNGVSRFRSLMLQLGLSQTPGLGLLTMNLPNMGLPPLVYPAFGLGLPTAVEEHPWVPRIEVKSKHKKDAFGHKKWKEMRAVLDTGGTAGNWVSLETLDDLGIKEYNKLSLNGIEAQGAQCFNGATIRASGVVDLTWRAIPGPHFRGNSTRNFKMRFLVLDSDIAPFSIQIGAESLLKYKILGAPNLMAKSRGEIVALPAQPRPTGVEKKAEKPTHEERKAANEKKKKAEKDREAKKKKDGAQDKEEEKQEKEAEQKYCGPAPKFPGNTTTKSKQGQSGPAFANSDSRGSLDSVKSHQKDSVEKPQALTTETKKPAKEPA